MQMKLFSLLFVIFYHLSGTSFAETCQHDSQNYPTFETWRDFLNINYENTYRKANIIQKGMYAERGNFEKNGSNYFLYQNKISEDNTEKVEKLLNFYEDFLKEENLSEKTFCYIKDSSFWLFLITSHDNSLQEIKTVFQGKDLNEKIKIYILIAQRLIFIQKRGWAYTQSALKWILINKKNEVFLAQLNLLVPIGSKTCCSQESRENTSAQFTPETVSITSTSHCKTCSASRFRNSLTLLEIIKMLESDNLLNLPRIKPTSEEVSKKYQLIAYVDSSIKGKLPPTLLAIQNFLQRLMSPAGAKVSRARSLSSGRVSLKAV